MLAAVLGLSLAGAVATAGESDHGTACLNESVPTLGPIQDEAPGSVAFQLLERNPGSEPGVSLDARCTGERLSQLHLKLEPGRTHVLILVAGAGAGVPLFARPASSPEASASGYWKIITRPVEIDDNGAIQDRLFRGGQVRMAQLFEITVTAGEATRPGQRQEFVITNSLHGDKDGQSLRLILEAVDDERMFRDNFQLDPKVGQFSHRRPQALPDASADAGVAGTGL